MAFTAEERDLYETVAMAQDAANLYGEPVSVYRAVSGTHFFAGAAMTAEILAEYPKCCVVVVMQPKKKKEAQCLP